MRKSDTADGYRDSLPKENITIISSPSQCSLAAQCVQCEKDIHCQNVKKIYIVNVYEQIPLSSNTPALSYLPLYHPLSPTRPYTVKSRTAQIDRQTHGDFECGHCCHKQYSQDTCSHVLSISCTFQSYILFKDQACVARTVNFFYIVTWLDKQTWTARYLSSNKWQLRKWPLLFL